MTLWAGSDPTSATPLALGEPSAVTGPGAGAEYRSAPIVLDADARAALTGSGAAQVGLSGPEGAVGGWTVVVLWTDDSVSSAATVQIDDAVQLIAPDDSIGPQVGTTVSLFDLDNTSANLSDWLFSWYDELGELRGDIVRLLSGARIFPGTSVGTFSPGEGATRGLLYGPVITPR